MNYYKVVQLDRFHDEKFCFIVSKITTLTKLFLPNESKVNDVGFRHLCKMSQLDTLQLRGNHIIIDFSPIKKLKQLKNLNLSACVYVDNRLCEWIAGFKLEFLNLSYCYQVNMNGLQSFFFVDHRELSNFQFLNINVNATFISSVLSKKCALTTLTLNSLSVDQELYKSLLSLKKVEDLSIIGCAKIEDFRALRLKNLKHLLICRTAFDTFGNKGLATFVSKHPNIKVHLYDAYHLQHRDVREISKHNNIFLEYS